MFARKELFAFTTLTGFDIIASQLKPLSLRQSLRQQMSNDLDYINIEFLGAVVNGQIFNLRISKDKFAGKYSYLDGNNQQWMWTAFDTNFITTYNEEYIKSKAEILTDIINDQKNPDGSKNPHVRVFICQNLGVTKDLSQDYGYQYLLPSGSKDSRNWIPRTTSYGYEVSYIDIDLRNGADLEWQQIKLRYLAMLSLSIEEDPRYLGNKHLSFIMKKWNPDIQASIDDPNSICVFNHKFIAKFQPLFSRDGAPEVQQSVRYQKITLTGSYEDVSWHSDWSTRWANNQKFIPIWASSRKINLILFDHYHNFINEYRNRAD